MEIENEVIVSIRVPYSPYWIQFEKQKNKRWDYFLIEKNTNYKEIIEKNATRELVIMYTISALRQPFPKDMMYKDIKQAVKNYIIKIIKKSNAKLKRSKRSKQLNGTH